MVFFATEKHKTNIYFSNMWKTDFNKTLSLFGHRNWIVVADKAYPQQIGEGVITLDTDEDLPQVLDYVLSAVKAAPHVQPQVYTDLELKYMDDSIMAGAEKMRKTIYQTIGKYVEGDLQCLHHNKELFPKFDAVSKQFSILVIKTNCTIPYSSVFLELGCGYWSDEKETMLRKKMGEI